MLYEYSCIYYIKFTFAKPVLQIFIKMTKISLKYIAESLNVAKSTVSLVLNGRGDEQRIGKETQEKIIKFANEHNYKADPLARSLSIGKTNTIGLIVPNISDTFFAQIARSIEKKAEMFGYNVIFSSTGESPEKESKIIQSMLDRKVDGLIIASSEQNSAEIRQLKKNNYPFVLVDREYPEIETNYVGLSSFSGVASAVECLIKNGRKRIGFVSLTLNLQTIKCREQGYLQTMEKHQLEIKDDYVQKVTLENLSDSVGDAIKILTNNENNVDGIVFATQYLTVEGMRVLRQLNIDIPQNVAIVSFGHKIDFDLFSPAITAVSLPIREMGDEAVNLLLANLQEGISDFKHIEMKTELIVRESCGS